MNMKLKASAVVFFAGSYFIAPFAAAEEAQDRFYAKAELGSSTFSSFASGKTTVVSESKVGDSWALTAGLQLSEYLSFELTHNEFGKSDGKADIPTVGVTSFDSSVSSNALSVIPSLPLGEKTRFFVELGQHVWEADVSLGNGTDNIQDGSDFFYAIGFSYDVREQIRTGFDFSRYNVDSDDFKNISVSLSYLF